MPDAIHSLIGSRKFLLVTFVVLAMLPLVYLGRLSVSDFVANVEKLTMVLVSAIAVEGFAEKWPAPPPQVSVAVTPTIPPPPNAPTIPDTTTPGV